MSSTSPESPAPTPSPALRNVTIDNDDSSLEFSQGWSRTESSEGSFHISDKFNETVTLSLPDGAVAYYYFGFKQKAGAFYGGCLDCSRLNESTLDAIDAHTNGTDTEKPTLLYQRTDLDPNVKHKLIVVNAHDPRFENEESTITLDSFVVMVREEAVDDPTHNGQSTTEGTPPTSTISVATESAETNSGGNTSANKLRSPFLLVGVLIATLLVLSTVLFALMYFMRRRKRRKTAPGADVEGHWATRFFGNGSGTGFGERASVWLGRGGTSAATPANRAKARSMVEKKLAGDQFTIETPNYRSLPSPPSLSSPPRLATGVQSRARHKSVEPARRPPNGVQYSIHQPMTIARKRSASEGSARPTNSPAHQHSSRDNTRLARNPSVNPGPGGASTGPPIPVGPGLGWQGPSRIPGVAATENSYVAEAHARVNDRALGASNPDVYQYPYLTGSAPVSGTMNGYLNAFTPPGPGPGYGYAQFGPVRSYGYGYENEYGYGVGGGGVGQYPGAVFQGNGPWGTQYGR